VPLSPLRCPTLHPPPPPGWLRSSDCSYNLRVVECRLAAALLARKLGKGAADAAAINTLQEVRVAEEGEAGGRAGGGGGGTRGAQGPAGAPRPTKF